MIISASRRTDLLSFYPRETIDQILSIHKREKVDGVVFWTKNAMPIFSYLDELDKECIPFYFQYTLNGYKDDLEPGFSRELKNDIVKNINDILNNYGNDSVVWRYDPIIITEDYSCYWHHERFESLCNYFYRYHNKLKTCVISFIDTYGKLEQSLSQYNIKEVNAEDKNYILKHFIDIAKTYKISLETCSEIIGIKHREHIKKSSCVDIERFKRIKPYYNWGNYEKDPSQRKLCGCCMSVDIGSYRTCKHGCIYCYAK